MLLYQIGNISQIVKKNEMVKRNTNQKHVEYKSEIQLKVIHLCSFISLLNLKAW